MYGYTAYPRNMNELKPSQNQAAHMIGQQRQTLGTERRSLFKQYVGKDSLRYG
jgi:hypothetical protein